MDINKILSDHEKWIKSGGESGTRAYLVGANLANANLVGAYLVGAYLVGAYLANATLANATLANANLVGAYLVGATLANATLANANLVGANLTRADLANADLANANLTDADLTGTCLDPKNIPNGDCDGFLKFALNDGTEWAIGYRTKNSPIIPGQKPYETGELRKAPWFSTSTSSCHPGLYVRPKKNDGDICVIFRPWECHHAGDKWRVKWFIVWGDDFKAEEI